MNEQAINIYFGITIFIQIMGVGYNIAKDGEPKKPDTYKWFGVTMVLIAQLLFAYHYTTLFK